MTRSPTLEELRRTVHKQRHREIGNWLARRVSRPMAVYGTWLAVRLRLSAHQVTLLALGAEFIGAAAIGSGTRAGFIAGVVLLHVWYWLDHVDGQVARWWKTASLDGVFFDYLMHHTWNLVVGFVLGYGMAARTGDPAWAIAGGSMALGWSILALANDCRYKAFFQRLKREETIYRIDGGSGGKPAPAPSWPRRGRGMLTWPAYKSCEPHVILLGLTLMAGFAAFVPEVWLASWRWSVRGMAVLAPMLAAARCARVVARGAVNAEFDAWFHPWVEPGHSTATHYDRTRV